MSWIEFETRGALEYIGETEEAAKVGPITIRYSKTDGVYDLMVYAQPKYWIYEYSFTNFCDAESKAKELTKNG